MISENSFSKEWMENFRSKGKRRIDLMILEKMIRALSLVELLKVNEIDFIFKGGTSLALLLQNPERFSIDIDILTTESKDLLEEKLNELCESSVFLRVEENVRSSQNSNIPKAHYKFHYKSNINSRENYILLDILFEKDSYPELVECEVKNKYLDTKGELIKVKTPSINSITGDKLTAFAPNTIGILYNKNKSQEIIKQLFDIGNLFDKITDFSIVEKSYRDIASNEIIYRNKALSLNDTLDDTIQTAILIAMRDKNKGENLTRYQEVLSGIREFSSFTIRSNFTLDNAIEAAAKAALIAIKIKVQDNDPITPFDDQLGMRNYLIENVEYNYLNRLVRLPNNALYYWNQTIKLFSNNT